MACTPITSVKKALPNSINMVMVMNRIVGPFSIDPVRLARRYRSFRMGTRMIIDQPTQIRRMYNAVRPVDAFASATLRARSTQPMISLPTPAERTTIPTYGTHFSITQTGQVVELYSLSCPVTSALSRCDREPETP